MRPRASDARTDGPRPTRKQSDARRSGRDHRAADVARGRCASSPRARSAHARAAPRRARMRVLARDRASLERVAASRLASSSARARRTRARARRGTTGRASGAVRCDASSARARAVTVVDERRVFRGRAHARGGVGARAGADGVGFVTTSRRRPAENLGEALDAFDERAEPVLRRGGEVWRSEVGKKSRIGVVWFALLGVIQALVRVLAAPSLANVFEAAADGAILTLIVAPAAAALATRAYEAWCSFQLRVMSPKLPYTLSPYAINTKNPSAKLRDESFAVAVKARGKHRRFARVKAARTYAQEICAQFATAAVEAPRRAVAVALGLKALSILNVKVMNPALDSILLSVLIVAAVSANLLERRRGPTKLLKEMRFVEDEYLKAQTKGTFLCRWASDPYEDPAEVNATSKDKALTNAAVANALETSCEIIGIPPEASMALVLDAADARTSRQLMAVGVPRTSIWVPNLYTHVVCALRKNAGINAVATKVEAFLAARDPRETQLQVIYLDHCGAIDGRTQQLFDVFSRHTIADGGVLAVTFSTRGKRIGNSKAASVQLAAKAIVEAAELHGYVLEGDAAPDVPGLVDYSVAVRPELGGGGEVESAQANAAKNLRKSADAVEASLLADNDSMIASSLAQWLEDSAAQGDSDEALSTAKDRRRRRLAEDLSTRATESLKSGEALPQADARALRSLAREVVSSTRAAADLRDPKSPRFASAKGTVPVERSYPKCLYLYKTLMFFVFRVRVARSYNEAL